MKQLDKRNCFTLIAILKLSKQERKRAMHALIFLTEKRDTSVEGQMVHNGQTTHEWLNKEDGRFGKHIANFSH